MTSIQAIYKTYRRFRTLQTHRISSMPIVILMPHSACNCRCVMCDIWKGNNKLKQLTVTDIQELLKDFNDLGTRQVLMSGGEALLNPQFFQFCELLNKKGIKITLLSTGLSLGKNAAAIVQWVDNIIVSIDGEEALHDKVRNIPGAFGKMKEGIDAIRTLQPAFKITGRTVIHRLNFRNWDRIIESAKEIGLNQISFLPADVSSHAFNREVPWDQQKQNELLLNDEEVTELDIITARIIRNYATEFEHGYIAESPEKILKIAAYYAAQLNNKSFPAKKCNAPWVSAVVEADGTVRPCFFHASIGNIRTRSFGEIINSDEAIAFRKNLDMEQNDTCKKCVCYLNLKPTQRI